jgi:DUF1680 family protein
VADYHNIIYFHDDADISVNLYAPSEVRWRQVTLRQETEFPESDVSTIRLTMDQPAAFAVRFRVPGWCTGMSIAVNGQPASAAAVPGTWARLERAWQTNDEITVCLPMALRALAVDRQHPDRVAIVYGPVVLAQDEACCRRPFALERGERLESRLICDSVPLRFTVVDGAPERHQRWLEPLYRLPGFWPYWVYFDLNAPPLY